MDRAWLDSRAAAKLLGVHYKTLEKHARNGEVPGYFRLGRWYFVEAELDAWMREGLYSARPSVRVN